MNEKHEKLQEALRETVAEFLSREASRQSLITVTRVELSENNRRATVFMTVMPESAESAALGFANRSRHEFAKFFESRVRGVRTPHVVFMIDRGQKNRQRLDELSPE